MGDYAKFTFNSIAARANREARKKKGEYFWPLPSQWGYYRARYVRKIFSAPLRTERENMDFQSISNFLVQRLGRERERGEPSERGRGLFLWWRRDPPLPSYSVPLSLRIASSFSSRIMRELVFLSVSLISKDNNVLIRL